MASSLSILVAIPNKEGSQVSEYLEKQGFPVLLTHSQGETLAILRERKDFRGVVIISDWAMENIDDSAKNIIQFIQGKIPTVTIVTEASRQQNGYQYMEEVFFPPDHDYMTTPFSLDELVGRMRKVGMV